MLNMEDALELITIDCKLFCFQTAILILDFVDVT